MTEVSQIVKGMLPRSIPTDSRAQQRWHWDNRLASC